MQYVRPPYPSRYQQQLPNLAHKLHLYWRRPYLSGHLFQLLPLIPQYLFLKRLTLQSMQLLLLAANSLRLSAYLLEQHFLLLIRQYHQELARYFLILPFFHSGELELRVKTFSVKNRSLPQLYSLGRPP